MMTRVEVADCERRVMLHALGLTPCNGKMRRWGYRNYYVAPTDNPGDKVIFDDMEQRGLIKTYETRGPGMERYRTWFVTAAGIEALGVGNRVRRGDRLG